MHSKILRIFSRRSAMIALASFLPSISFSVAKAQHINSSFVLDNIFKQLIDTIIPQDDYAGAVALGIDKQIWLTIKASQSYLAKITVVLRQLNELSGSSFSMSFDQLSLDQRTHLIELVLNERFEGSRIQRHILNLRIKTLMAYYAHPKANQMLHYHPPLQGGYPDYAAPLANKAS